MTNTMKVLPTVPGRRLLCIGLAVVMPLLAAQAAVAQTDAERLEALRACLGIESDSARLLCFESIVSAQTAGTEASGERAAGIATNEGVEPAAEAEPPEATTASARGDEPDDPVADGPEPTRPATAEPAADGALAADVTRERPRGRDQERENVADPILIVEASRRYRGNAVFATDDGRRFVQTSGNTARVLPEAPFEATLQDGAFGSMFLVARSAGLRVRVREQAE